MAGNALFKSRWTDRKGTRGRTNFCGRGARIVSLAARGGGGAGQCEARFGKGEKLCRTWTRDRLLHRRSKHQLHERLEGLLHIRSMLSHGIGRSPLRGFIGAKCSESMA